MAENIPPSTAAHTDAKPANPSTTSTPGSAPTSEATARGLPYYEKLRRDLRDTIQKKRILDKNLATLEDTLFRYETSYLEDTSPAGNIIKGFDNYIKGSSVGTGGAGGGGGAGTISGAAAGGAGGGNRKRAVVVDGDRVFSRSSVGSVKAEVGGTGLGGIGGAESSPATTPAATTPGSAVGAEKKNKKGGNKKKTVVTSAVDDEETGGGSSAAEAATTGPGTKKNKRMKVSYGRD